MEITTQHELDDTVYYLQNNKITSSTVYRITVTVTGEITHIVYRLTNTATISEDNTYNSKDSLVKGLLE